MEKSADRQRSRPRHRWFAFCAACWIVACTSTTEPPAPCGGDIAVSVATGATPRFSWAPDCGVSLLAVTTVPTAAGDHGRTVWGFTVSERTPLGPSVTYGVNPPGATVWSAPEPLQIGDSYRVYLAYTVGGDVLVASGETTFNWFPPD